MRFQIFILLFMFSVSNVFAQKPFLSAPPQSVEEAKEYLTKNIQNIDPIEGLYYVDIILDIHSAYDGRESVRQNAVCSITKTPREDSFIVQGLKGDLIGPKAVVEKMGGKDSYSYLKPSIKDGKTMITIPFKLTDLFSFNIVESDSRRTASAYIETRFVKKYPTIDMYSSKGTSSGKSSGTGFFLNKDGYIVTNYHVIDNAIDGNIKVTSINGDNNKSFGVEVLVTDKQNDLAILRISDTTFIPQVNIPYTFKFNTSRIGEDCFVLGYPLISSMGKDIKLTNGIISSKTGYDGNIAQYQISAPVQAGNSGAPLFDKDGNIIGIIQAKHSDAENAGYAIKANYIMNLIDLLPTPIVLPEYNILKGKELPQQVELASKAVCIIIVNGE